MQSGLTATSDSTQALVQGKIVYMAVPRLRNQKPFIELDPAKLNCPAYTASSIQGATNSAD